MRSLGTARSALTDAAAASRFLLGLPAFARYRLDPAQSRSILVQRLERRAGDFLDLMKRAVFGRPGSPYRALLRHAGCELGDLERLVRDDGLEGALRALLHQGVYLTVDEIKGRRPVVRGHLTLSVGPEDCWNPLVTAHLLRYRSGSSDGRVLHAPVPIDFAHLRDRAVNIFLSLEARGGHGWDHAYWHVPGSMAMVDVLETLVFGRTAARWFSQLDPLDIRLHPRYRWSARAMLWECALLGLRLPPLQHASFDDPAPVLDWIVETRRAGRVPHLKAFASSAVRLSQAALAAGLDLEGVQITASGEPVTRTRLEAIHRSGARAVQRAGAVELGPIGYGCLEPETAGDLHHYRDLHVLVQPGRDGCPAGLRPQTLLFSTLRTSSRLVLLNVSIGDEAVVVHDECGCPLAALGWRTRLRGLCSHEKLTTGGMGFLDVDVLPILEDVLPRRFGGGPADFQLVESEGEQGEPRLRLLVHPSVGPLDAQAVVDAFFEALGPGCGVERIMALQWRESQFLAVERRAPLMTAVGKVQHLHRERGRT
jgi:hypothetical protein